MNEKREIDFEIGKFRSCAMKTWIKKKKNSKNVDIFGDLKIFHIFVVPHAACFAFLTTGEHYGGSKSVIVQETG